MKFAYIWDKIMKKLGWSSGMEKFTCVKLLLKAVNHDFILSKGYTPFPDG